MTVSFAGEKAALLIDKLEPHIFFLRNKQMTFACEQTEVNAALPSISQLGKHLSKV